MVKTATASATYSQAADLSPAKQKERFCNVLLHDDRSSYYVVATLESGRWKEVGGVSVAELGVLDTMGRPDVFVTHNGFTGRRRNELSCRQITALLLDIDFHDSSLSFDARRARKDEVLRRVFEAKDKSFFPAPTIIVDTGRGLQVYFVLDRSIPYRLKGGVINERAINLAKRVQERLFDAAEEILAGVPGVEVDRSVGDLSRVSRLPGTWNSKAGEFCRLVYVDEKQLWNLFSLYAFGPRREEQQRRRASVAASAAEGVEGLLMSRLQLVEDLRDYRNGECGGHRELMCFVYYNTAVQLHSPQTAQIMTWRLNESFTEPLPPAEIEEIFRSVSKVVYRMKAETVAQKLGMTQAEREATGFLSSKTAKRAEARRKTAARRAERDRRIVALYAAGGTTQEAVAAAVGCCSRTVFTVLKRNGLTRPHSASRKGMQAVLAARAAALRAEAEEASSQKSAPRFCSVPLTVSLCGLDPAFTADFPAADPPGLGVTAA